MSDTIPNADKNRPAGIDEHEIKPDPLAGDGDGADGDDALAGPDEPVPGEPVTGV